MFPRLFHFGNFSLPTYGVMAALGMIAGLSVVVRGARRERVDPDRAWNLGIIGVLAGIIGAKILMVINDWHYYAEHPKSIFTLATLQAGGVFYGGLLAALAAAFVYMRYTQMPLLKTCDVFAPGIALGHAIGRLGCFAAGCCYGKETHVPWAVTFTNPLANQWTGTPLNIPMHPTQIYEFLVEGANFLFLWWLLKRKRFDGQIMGTYMFLYGIARFFLEFLRGDPERGSAFNGALSYTQLISIGLVIVGGILWARGVRTIDRPVVATASR
jgi:phosphatidylglycerol---prolipoprotein diacylglyceryl transferase